jgi:hypothetical protein
MNENKRNYLIVIIAIVAAVSVTLVNYFAPSQDVLTSRSQQANNYSISQIENFEHNATLGTKQVSILDADGEQISSFGGATAVADYKSPEDFTATFTSGTTLTLASLPFAITDDSQLVYIRVIPASGDAETYINGSGGVTLRESANVVTISGAGTAPFVTGDVYEVGINYQAKGYDATNDLVKTQEQSPLSSHYTDVATISTSDQDFTAAWVDYGGEQATAGYNTACVYITIKINNTDDPRWRFLAKHTSAGAEEYEFPIETLSASDIAVEGAYYEANVDENQLVVTCLDLGNAIPYIQMQIQAGTPDDGGGTEGQVTEAYIIKGY